jgi:murein DD-endopeptidase MepM/ murein hydrolase activator NlpD
MVNRSRWIRGAAVSGLVLLVAATLPLWGRSSRRVAVVAPPVPAPVVAVSDEPDLQTRRGTLRKGDSLFSALRRQGFPASPLFEILAELKTVLDLRRLSPGDSYSVFLRGGLIEGLKIVRAGATYVVEKDGSGFRARMEPFPVETRVRKLTGVVQSSLYDAIVENGGKPALVAEVSDLLAWDIDFFTDPRKGDRFTILVEELERSGEVVGYGEILYANYVGERVSRDAVFYADAEGHADHYDSDGQSLRREFLKSPLNYRRISSRFSHRRFHPILKTVRPHLGVDYSATWGTPVVSIGSGNVVYAGWKGGFGRTVEIRHNGSYATQYAHLSSFAAGIRRGARVSQGQVVGHVGSTGLSTGPHLDFRVKRDGSFIDPLSMKSPPALPVAAAYRAAFDEYRARMVRAESELASAEGLGSDEFLTRFFSDALTAGVIPPE